MTKPQKWLLSIMDVANTCVYFPSLAIFLMYTLLMQLLTIAKLLLRLFASLLNTPRKMHKSKLSQNFYTIGRNNELKETSSNLFPNNGRIPDGTDFNSLLTVGKYFVISNDETQTMTNIPEKMAGRLFVLNMLGDDKVLNKGYQYFIQIYLLYTGTLWTRSLTREADDSPIVFNNWVKRW